MDAPSLAALQSIADSLKPHLWPQSAGDLAQIALIILTILTVIYLRRYTLETIELRRATRDQVEVSNQVLGETIKLRAATQEQVAATNQLLTEEQKQTVAAGDQIQMTNRVLEEARIQNTQSLMPIVVLTTRVDQQSKSCFAFVNMGKGPAFNLEADDIRLNATGEAVSFYPRKALAAGEEDLVFTQHNNQRVVPIDVIRLLSYENNVKEADMTITYSSSEGKVYQTLHHVSYRGSALYIDFRSFKSIAGAVQ